MLSRSRGSVQVARSFIPAAFLSRSQPEDHKAPRRVAAPPPQDRTNRNFGLAIAVAWRSDPGLRQAFYAAAADGTASEAAVSPWSFAALALSPCIKNSWPDTHATDEWQDAGQQYDACADCPESPAPTTLTAANEPGTGAESYLLTTLQIKNAPGISDFVTLSEVAVKAAKFDTATGSVNGINDLSLTGVA